MSEHTVSLLPVTLQLMYIHTGPVARRAVKVCTVLTALAIWHHNSARLLSIGTGG